MTGEWYSHEEPKREAGDGNNEIYGTRSRVHDMSDDVHWASGAISSANKRDRASSAGRHHNLADEFVLQLPVPAMPAGVTCSDAEQVDEAFRNDLPFTTRGRASHPRIVGQ